MARLSGGCIILNKSRRNGRDYLEICQKKNAILKINQTSAKCFSCTRGSSRKKKKRKINFKLIKDVIENTGSTILKEYLYSENRIKFIVKRYDGTRKCLYRCTYMHWRMAEV